MCVIDSLVSILISIFLLLAFMTLLAKIIPGRVAAALMLALLFFRVIHPMVRQRVLFTAMALIGALLPLFLIILGLWIMIRGNKIR